MLNSLTALVRLTLTAPREAAAVLLGAESLKNRGFELVALVVVLGVLISAFVAMLNPAAGNALSSGMLANPLLFAVIQFMILFLTIVAMFAIGRMFGGHGSFEGALILSVWLQIMSLLVQLALIPVVLISPELAQSLMMLIYIYFMWLLTNFIAALHGFKSLLKVFGGVLATSFAAAFLFIILLAFVGVNVE